MHGGMNRELLLVATLMILTAVALGLRAPLSMQGGGASRMMLAVPGRR